MRHSKLDAVVVDHRHPICDGYCRCTACKPSRGGAAGAARSIAAMLYLAPWAAIAAVFWIVR